MLKQRVQQAVLYWVYDFDLCQKLDGNYEILKSLLNSGLIDIIQFRAKNLDEAAYEKWVAEVLPLVNRQTTLVFSNDFVEVVNKLNLDGVHVGQDDMPVEKAREILGDEKLIGATARSEERALLADGQNADYLGVGTVFETSTKQGLTAKGPQFISHIKSLVKCPVFPIGGIEVENAAFLQSETNVGCAAIASCLLRAQNPLLYAEKLKKVFTA